MLSVIHEPNFRNILHYQAHGFNTDFDQICDEKKTLNISYVKLLTDTLENNQKCSQ